MSSSRIVPVLNLKGLSADVSADSVPFFDTTTIDSAQIELLTIAETAKLLRISEVSVRRLQQGRHLPFIKVGGRVRFAKADIIGYLSRHRVESIER